MLTKRLMASSDRKRTPLKLAAESGETEVVIVLLEAGADPEAQDDYGQTPLHVAAKNGDVDIVTAMLEAGANWKANTLTTKPYGVKFTERRNLTFR